jgi:hypothetical protein
MEWVELACGDEEQQQAICSSAEELYHGVATVCLSIHRNTRQQHLWAEDGYVLWFLETTA